MTGSFGEDELFEDEWVEICDIEGHRISMRHLATMQVDQKIYMLLDDGKEEHEGSLMLVREDRTVDGAPEYVVSNDEQEIERVMQRFVAHLFEMDMAGSLPDALPGPEEWDAEEQDEWSMEAQPGDEGCGCEHGPWAFCYCGDPDYLQ